MAGDLEKGLISKIHIAKKDLGFSEERYRALLQGITGKDSCKDMTLSELDAVIKALQKEGFVVKVKKGGSKRSPVNSPEQKKIWAIWFSLVEAGKVTNSKGGLNAFIKRQTGIESIDWIKSSEDADKVIEGLKAIQKRVGARMK